MTARVECATFRRALKLVRTHRIALLRQTLDNIYCIVYKFSLGILKRIRKFLPFGTFQRTHRTRFFRVSWFIRSFWQQPLSTELLCQSDNEIAPREKRTKRAQLPSHGDNVREAHGHEMVFLGPQPLYFSWHFHVGQDMKVRPVWSDRHCDFGATFPIAEGSTAWAHISCLCS
jgi:hypothetical protein